MDILAVSRSHSHWGVIKCTIYFHSRHLKTFLQHLNILFGFESSEMRSSTCLLDIVGLQCGRSHISWNLFFQSGCKRCLHFQSSIFSKRKNSLIKELNQIFLDCLEFATTVSNQRLLFSYSQFPDSLALCGENITKF